MIVVGRPRQRSWTDTDGTEHQVTEIDAEEIGPSLRWARPGPRPRREAVRAAVAFHGRHYPAGRLLHPQPEEP